MRVSDVLKNKAIAAHDDRLGDGNCKISELEEKCRILTSEKKKLEEKVKYLKAENEKLLENTDMLNDFMIVAQKVKNKREELGKLKIDVFA